MLQQQQNNDPTDPSQQNAAPPEQAAFTEAPFMQPMEAAPSPALSNTMKWYQQSWATILFLILFFPVGLVLMWMHMRWNIVVKVIITCVIVLFAAYVMMNPAAY